MAASEAKQRRHHFVLVHGMCHGAWCWYKAGTALRRAGHRATALDMHTFEEYSRPLLDAMAALPAGEQVVLVAHSHSGYSVALAIERFPDKVVAAVFVAASMPAIGRPMAATSDEDLTLGLMLIKPANAFTTGNPDEAVMRDEKLLTEVGYGSVRRVFVVVEEDHGIPAGGVRGAEPRRRSEGDHDHIAMLSRSLEQSSWFNSSSELPTNRRNDR